MNKKHVYFIMIIIVLFSAFYFISYVDKNIADDKERELIKQGVLIEKARASNVNLLLWNIAANTPKDILSNITNHTLFYGLFIKIHEEKFDEETQKYQYNITDGNLTLSLVAKFPDVRSINVKSVGKFNRYLYYNYTYELQQNMDDRLKIKKIYFNVDFLDVYQNGTSISGILGDDNDVSNIILSDDNKINESIFVLYEGD